jgi:tetratricopeptide (TPR) repeat protein
MIFWLFLQQTRELRCVPDFRSKLLANSKSFFSPRILVALIVVAGVGLMAYFYFSNRTPEAPRPDETPTVEQASITLPVVSGGDSFESPVSPVSPVTPADQDNDSPNAFPAPETFAVLIEQGQNLYDAEDFEGALQVFDEAITVLPDSPIGYDARGTIFVELEDFDRAMADYDKAIEIYPGFAQAYYNRGRLFERLGQHEEALSDLRQTVTLDADFGYLANGLIGLILYNQREYEPAIEALDAAIAFNGLYGDVYYFKGEALSRLQRYEEAISNYESAIERFPNYGSAYRGLGYARFKVGQFDQALEALTQAVTNRPNDPETHLQLAVVHMALEDAETARAEIEMGLSLADELPPEVKRVILRQAVSDLETLSLQSPENAESIQSLVKLITEVNN